MLFYRVLAADGLLGATKARTLSSDRKDKRHGTSAENIESGRETTANRPETVF